MADYRSANSIAEDVGQRFGLTPQEVELVSADLRHELRGQKDSLGRLPDTAATRGFAANLAKGYRELRKAD